VDDVSDVGVGGYDRAVLGGTEGVLGVGASGSDEAFEIGEDSWTVGQRVTLMVENGFHALRLFAHSWRILTKKKQKHLHTHSHWDRPNESKQTG
jgi:hypothetical protein